MRMRAVFDTCITKLFLVALFLLAFGVAGCAADSGAASADPNGPTLMMSASAFAGATSITIPAGQSLALDDPAATGGIHNLVTGTDGLFAAAPGAPMPLGSPAGIDFRPGDKQLVMFAQPGTYHITCTIHPMMQAVITVT